MPFNELQMPTLAGDFQRIQAIMLDAIQAYRNGTLETREALLEAYGNAVALYQKTASNSLYEYEPVLPDTEPNTQWQQEIANGINKDLVLLFAEMNALAILMTNVFNQQVSERDDLVGRIKRVNSKLGDYLLLSGEGGLSVSDSFINTDYIDVGSSLISTEEAEINTIEGAITSTEREIIQLEVESILIDSQNSNGVLGNNQEIGITELHNDLNAITDGNPDTWTEYENVVFSDSINDSLRLRLVLKLTEQSIFNRIEIDPVNFGQLGNVLISDIRVSADGQTWTSVVGDIPLASYLGETEENVFVLSQESSKFTGKFSYTFLPRKVSHVALDLVQENHFLINTARGSQSRFVIGIKGIDLYSVKFATTSQIVSVPLSVSNPISKLALLAAYRPENSDLGNVLFDISLDGGTTWKSIQPLTEDDLSSDEVLTLDTLPSSFIYKLTLNRNDEAFSDLDDFDETENTTTTVFDTKQINLDVSPAVITPNRQMANNDVVVMNGPIGSRSNLRRPGLPRFSIGNGTGDILHAKLPFDLFPSNNIKKADVRVYVNGKLWTQLLDEAALSAAAPDDRVYFINDDNEIVFGDGDPVNATGNGRSPPSNSAIDVSLPVESLFLTPTENGYLAELDLPSNGNKKTSILQHVAKLSGYVSEIITVGETEINLQHSNIDPNNILITERTEAGASTPTALVTLKANLSELATLGDYYIDYKRGIIYLYETASTIATITYKYYPLSEQENYSWIRDDAGKFSGIFISNTDAVIDTWIDTSGSARAPYSFGGLDSSPTPANVSSTTKKVITLSQNRVVPGTVVLQNGIFGIGIKPIEVDFVDGHTELRSTTAITSESLASITVTSPGVHTIQLAGGVNIASANGVVFSNNTYFATEVVTPSSPGEYSINFSTGVVSVYLNSNMPTGIIASYYVKAVSTSTDGRYSIDYRNGKIYTANTVLNGYMITYNYSKYRLHYPVMRALSTDEFSVDVERNTITIDTVLLDTEEIQIAYQFNNVLDANLNELIEYYSPIVRDVRWRILTEV